MAADEVSSIGVKLTLDASTFMSGMSAATGETNAFVASVEKASTVAGSVGSGKKTGSKSSLAQNISGVSVDLSVSAATISKLRKQIIEGLGTIPVNVTANMAKTAQNEAKGVVAAVTTPVVGTRSGAAHSVETLVKQNLPRRAYGGPVQQGRDYVVGEHRPEVFRPRQTGSIHPDASRYYREQEQAARRAADAERQHQERMRRIPHRAQSGPAHRGGLPRGYQLEFMEEQTAGNIPFTVGGRVPTGVKPVKKPTITGEYKSSPASILAVIRKGDAVVGTYPFSYDSINDAMHPEMSYTDPEHRRRGLATAAYAKTERFTGKQIEPSGSQLLHGRALWNQQNRAFGRRFGSRPISAADQLRLELEAQGVQNLNGMDAHSSTFRGTQGPLGRRIEQQNLIGWRTRQFERLRMSGASVHEAADIISLKEFDYSESGSKFGHVPPWSPVNRLPPWQRKGGGPVGSRDPKHWLDTSGIEGNFRKRFTASTPEQFTEGAHWYQAWGKELRDQASSLDLDPKLLASVAASLSPNNGWPGNFHDAVRYAKAWSKGLPMPKASTYPANQEKAWNILQHQSSAFLSGLKVEPFSAALLGDRNAKPQDIWMKRAATGNLSLPSTKGTPSVRQRREMDRTIDLLASEYKMDPRQVQAIIWGVTRDAGMAEAGRNKHARLRAGGGGVESFFHMARPITGFIGEAVNTAAGWAKDPFMAYMSWQGQQGAKQARRGMADVVGKPRFGGDIIGKPMAQLPRMVENWFDEQGPRGRAAGLWDAVLSGRVPGGMDGLIWKNMPRDPKPHHDGGPVQAVNGTWLTGNHPVGSGTTALKLRGATRFGPKGATSTVGGRLEYDSLNLKAGHAKGPLTEPPPGWSLIAGAETEAESWSRTPEQQAAMEADIIANLKAGRAGLGGGIPYWPVTKAEKEGLKPRVTATDPTGMRRVQARERLDRMRAASVPQHEAPPVAEHMEVIARHEAEKSKAVEEAVETVVAAIPSEPTSHSAAVEKMRELGLFTSSRRTRQPDVDFEKQIGMKVPWLKRAAGGNAGDGLYIVNEVGPEAFIEQRDIAKLRANRPDILARVPHAADGARTGMIQKPAWSLFSPQKDGIIVRREDAHAALHAVRAQGGAWRADEDRFQATGPLVSGSNAPFSPTGSIEAVGRRTMDADREALIPPSDIHAATAALADFTAALEAAATAAQGSQGAAPPFAWETARIEDQANQERDEAIARATASFRARGTYARTPNQNERGDPDAAPRTAAPLAAAAALAGTTAAGPAPAGATTAGPDYANLPPGHRAFETPEGVAWMRANGGGATAGGGMGPGTGPAAGARRPAATTHAPAAPGQMVMDTDQYREFLEMGIERPAGLSAREQKALRFGYVKAGHERARAGGPKSAEELLGDVRQGTAGSAAWMSARTPKGVAAVYGEMFGGGAEFKRKQATLQRETMAYRRLGNIYDTANNNVEALTAGIEEANRVGIDSSGLQDQLIDHTQTRTIAEKNLTDQSEKLVAAEEAVQPKMGNIVKSFGSIIAATTAYGAAFSAANTIIQQALIPGIAKWADQMLGFSPMLTKVTGAMADSTREMGGNYKAAIAAKGVTSGMSASTNDWATSVLGATVVAKAGAKSYADFSEVFRASIGAMNKTGMPEGLGGGYGGILGSPLLGQQLGGGMGLQEEMLQDILASRGQTGINVPRYAAAAGLGVATGAVLGGGFVGAGVGGVLAAGATMATDIVGGDFNTGAGFNGPATIRSGSPEEMLQNQLRDASKRSADRNGQNAYQFAYQGRDVSDQYANAPKSMQNLAKQGYAIVDSSGKIVTAFNDIIAASEQLAQGLAIPDVKVWAQTVERQINVQFQSMDIQSIINRTLTIPLGFAMQRISAPLLAPGTGVVPGAGMAEVYGRNPGWEKMLGIPAMGVGGYEKFFGSSAASGGMGLSSGMSKLLAGWSKDAEASQKRLAATDKIARLDAFNVINAQPDAKQTIQAAEKAAVPPPLPPEPKTILPPAPSDYGLPYGPLGPPPNDAAYGQRQTGGSPISSMGNVLSASVTGSPMSQMGRNAIGPDAYPDLKGSTSLVNQNAQQYDALMNSAQSASNELLDLQTSLASLSAAAAQASWANTTRLALRSIGDAAGMLGQAGGSAFGKLERHLWQIGRASQALDLSLQRLQINFQKSMAGFQAPGLTSEQRAANQQMAQTEAKVAEKKLGYAQETYTGTGQEWKIQAQRNLVDAQAAWNASQKAHTAEVAYAAAQADIARLNAEIASDTAKADEIYKTAAGKMELGASSLAEYAKTFGGTIHGANKELGGLTSTVGKTAGGLRTFLEAMGFRFKPTKTGMSVTAPQITYAAATVQDPKAAGYLGQFGKGAVMTVGEAGPETVAILRNPRAYNPMGGGGMGGFGGGGGTTTFNLNLTVQGDVKDEATVAKIVRAVEDSFNRKAARIGMRSFVSSTG